MNKQTKVVIAVISVVLIVIIAISMVAIRKSHRVMNPNRITVELLQDFKERNANGEKITTTELKKYDVISTENEDKCVKTLYEFNDKYDLEAVSLNKIIISLNLVNRVTFTRCDVLNDEIIEFMKYD